MLRIHILPPDVNSPGVTEIRLSGTLDSSQVRYFREQVIELLPGARGAFLLDVRGLEFLDSAGARLFLWFGRLAAARECEWGLITGENRRVLGVLELLAWSGCLPVYPSRQDAVVALLWKRSTGERPGPSGRERAAPDRLGEGGGSDPLADGYRLEWYEFDPVTHYLSGERRCEGAAVQVLREMGETAARRCGLHGFDVDAVGVDFAAYVVTGSAPDVSRPQRSVLSYLQRAAGWFAAKQSRALRRKREVPLDAIEESQVDPGPDLVIEMDRQYLRKRLEEVLLSGSPEDRQVFEFCILQGCSSTEAAAALRCTPEAVRKRLQRLRTQLREALRSAVDEPF